MIQTSQDSNNTSVVEFLLEQLDNQIGMFGREIDLTKMGMNTSLAKKLEDMANNPIEHLSSLSSEMNGKVKKIIALKWAIKLQNHLQSNLSSVWLNDTSTSEIALIVSLENNSFEHREDVREILFSQYKKPVSKSHRVIVQIIGKEKEDSLRTEQLIRIGFE